MCFVTWLEKSCRWSPTLMALAFISTASMSTTTSSTKRFTNNVHVQFQTPTAHINNNTNSITSSINSSWYIMIPARNVSVDVLFICYPCTICCIGFYPCTNDLLVTCVCCFGWFGWFLFLMHDLNMLPHVFVSFVFFPFLFYLFLMNPSVIPPHDCKM